MSSTRSLIEISHNKLNEQDDIKNRNKAYIYLTPKSNDKINRLSPFKPNKHKLIKEINKSEEIKGVNLIYIFEKL